MKVLGNTLSDLKLSEMFNCYIEDRAIEHEAHQKRIADQYKEVTDDQQVMYRVMSGDRYVILTPENERVVIDYIDDKEKASSVTLDTAYDIKKYLVKLENEKPIQMRKVISVKLTKPRPSIMDYIRKNIPDFFQGKQKEDKEHPAIKFDAQRTKKMLDFLNKSAELEAEQREQLLREVEINNRRSKALAKK